MLRWFAALSMRRKILLFVAGGMFSLVFDAFVAHFSWNARTMRWTQAIPVAYGLLASVTLAAGALRPSTVASSDRVLRGVGALGLVVGGTGLVLHGLSLLEILEGEALSIIVVGKALSLAPPLLAPAAFAGVGLLLLALPAIAPQPR